MSLFELQAWLGHCSPHSTQHYARITPVTLTQAYTDAGYFARNVRSIEVLLDRDAITNGASRQRRAVRVLRPLSRLLLLQLLRAMPAPDGVRPLRLLPPQGRPAQAQLLEAKDGLQRCSCRSRSPTRSGPRSRAISTAIDRLLATLAGSTYPDRLIDQSSAAMPFIRALRSRTSDDRFHPSRAALAPPRPARRRVARRTACAAVRHPPRARRARAIAQGHARARGADRSRRRSRVPRPAPGRRSPSTRAPATGSAAGLNSMAAPTACAGWTSTFAEAASRRSRRRPGHDPFLDRRHERSGVAPRAPQDLAGALSRCGQSRAASARRRCAGSPPTAPHAAPPRAPSSRSAENGSCRLDRLFRTRSQSLPQPTRAPDRS